MKKLVFVSFAAALVGCSDARMSDWNSQGKPHHVVLYSGGAKIGEWDTTGVVLNQPQSDGFYFEDAATHKKVEVCGQLIITVK